MTFIVGYKKYGWRKTILEIIYCFKNYENVSILKLKSITENKSKRIPLASLYQKIEEFKNIRELTIPFTCELRANQTMMLMLTNLKKLVYLSLEYFDKQPKIAEVVQLLSNYAIDQLMELRWVKFTLDQIIKMENVNITQRVNPLTIIVQLVNGLTQYIYDNRYYGSIVVKNYINQ